MPTLGNAPQMVLSIAQTDYADESAEHGLTFLSGNTENVNT